MNRLCLASTTLAAPVRFGHDDNDPVDVVLAFGSPDDSSHLRLLQALAEHLMTGLAETLRAAPDREHAVEALRDVVREM